MRCAELFGIKYSSKTFTLVFVCLLAKLVLFTYIKWSDNVDLLNRDYHTMQFRTPEETLVVKQAIMLTNCRR